ncbi:MAG: PLDc N-terminal domain-containing protein [Longimicrobiales bacterium]
MRPLLALIVFGLDLWALASLSVCGLPRRRKLAWTAAILFIPVLGFVLWLRSSRHAPPEVSIPS